MNEFENSQESWDFRKIFAFLVILVVLFFGVKTFVLDTNLKKEVEGVNTREAQRVILESPKKEIEKNVQDKISELQKEVNNINVVEIATSAPAVQKFLNDFKNLQNLPQSEAKKACFKICEGIQ